MQIEFFSAGVAKLLSLNYHQAQSNFIGQDVFKPYLGMLLMCRETPRPESRLR